MEIKVLGPGCKNCKVLEKNVKKAVKNLGLEVDIEKVEEYKDIMAYGVMSTPGLVVDGEVKVKGRVPNVKEIEKILGGK
ncbi:MAG: thioredoxin family protein [Fusobacteriota bacterium]